MCKGILIDPMILRIIRSRFQSSTTPGNLTQQFRPVLREDIILKIKIELSDSLLQSGAMVIRHSKVLVTAVIKYGVRWMQQA